MNGSKNISPTISLQFYLFIENSFKNRKILQEIKKKVKTIDHFIYLSAVGFEQLFVDSSPETIKNLFEYNFNIPVIALNVFLRIFKKSKTHLSIFINFSGQFFSF